MTTVANLSARNSKNSSSAMESNRNPRQSKILLHNQLSNAYI
eukprot:CCRYP_013708-RB/>CCRYP_013708-RB protein AED:0.37 eAED:1.00 QI:0/-1/0/1/-1/0/1/0/41